MYEKLWLLYVEEEVLRERYNRKRTVTNYSAWKFARDAYMKALCKFLNAEFKELVSPKKFPCPLPKCPQPPETEESEGEDTMSDQVNKPQPPMVDYDENMWGFNKKILADTALNNYQYMTSHSQRLMNMAEQALQNCMGNANNQNTQATFHADIVKSLVHNGLVAQAATFQAGQGRQMTSADVALNRRWSDVDIAEAAIHAEVNRVMSALSPVLVDSVRGLMSTLVEAARNPQPGVQAPDASAATRTAPSAAKSRSRKR